VDYSKERKIRGETGFDSVNGEPLQVGWNRRIRNSLYAFIPKSMGFSQSLLMVPATGDTLPKNQISLDLGFIENIKVLPILQISNEYHRLFRISNVWIRWSYQRF